MMKAKWDSRKATAPVRPPIWLAREVTRNFRDSEEAAMDGSESSTHCSLSAAGGEVSDVGHLEGEEALMEVWVFMVKEETAAGGVGSLGR